MVITKNDYKFAGIEPDKPLNDAQMVGSSIFIGFRSLISFKTMNYSKPPLSFQQQIEAFKQRGLTFEDEHHLACLFRKHQLLPFTGLHLSVSRQ